VVRRFDRISLAVPDVAQAAAQYQQLFGLPGYVPPGSPAVAWWDLSNTVIELVEADVERPYIKAIIFNCPALAHDERSLPNSLGLEIRGCDGRATAQLRGRQELAAPAGLSVDHLVLRSNSAQRCLAFFEQELGMRLALDKTVPEWGGRMLFFRCGGLTLEVIESTRQPRNAFWGLAYQCRDLAQMVTDLHERGVAVSALREGRKPGTRVATVKSHCLDIPTLLLEPAR
jgi:catechol 2,3-dioxygenase-like lactoylglutathione lyase family enzyme